MGRPLVVIEKEVRSVSDADKEVLLRVLWEELDGPPDSDAESAWLDEIRRRSAELESGAVQGIPAEDVFARIRANQNK